MSCYLIIVTDYLWAVSDKSNQAERLKYCWVFFVIAGVFLFCFVFVFVSIFFLGGGGRGVMFGNDMHKRHRSLRYGRDILKEVFKY